MVNNNAHVRDMRGIEMENSTPPANQPVRGDIPTDKQFPGIYDGLDSSSINFIEGMLYERFIIGMPTSYEYLKDLVDEINNKNINQPHIT